MKISKRHLLNYSILIPYLLLSILGLIVVYSTTSAILIEEGKSALQLVRNQGIFWIVSLILIALIYKLKLGFLRNERLLFIVMFVELILLALARLIGIPVNGAYGWIKVGPITIQPAEYLKIIIVWYLAQRFSKQQDEIAVYDFQVLTLNQWLPRAFNDWRFVLLVMIGSLAIFPDLGNATILILVSLLMYTISGIAYRWFTTILGLLAGVSMISLTAIRIIGVEKFSKIPVFGYVAKRFSAFFNPFNDLAGAGHQLANSYYAMVNGGWFGLGLGNSIEKRGYLPEAHTDFVFSIVIEEFGFVGASLILALLFFLILRIILVGIRARDPFNSMVAIGIGGMILIQVFVNIGGVSGLIPSTGVTFPFLSQGGNSLLVLSVAIAFVLNIDASEKRARLFSEYEAQL
ncbi:cell division peptidoglycan polymerase FtsW [Streptococcus pneumoniae]|uniref:cell division peptidoglycan polymerase FtsW n=1 Tax=Streptococcus pneumoniae TaxID=1313 RepID=UPI000F842C0F|nr:FtsW/RodA/SpoVE family cell cycle protein [Streptococcus pneumoniae]RTZ11977.1 FtsW/RodA/SpoVE family cell cycle protein [Streptococcus pneumoniae]